MLPIAVVIATRPRPNLLIKHALPAVEAQQRKPDVIVVVSDERPFSDVEQDMLRRLTPSVKVVFGQNQNSQGAAGTWNTGFSILRELYKDCYVAIIDDDATGTPTTSAPAKQLREMGRQMLSCLE